MKSCFLNGFRRHEVTKLTWPTFPFTKRKKKPKPNHSEAPKANFFLYEVTWKCPFHFHFHPFHSKSDYSLPPTTISNGSSITHFWKQWTRVHWGIGECVQGCWKAWRIIQYTCVLSVLQRPLSNGSFPSKQSTPHTLYSFHLIGFNLRRDSEYELPFRQRSKTLY